MGLRLTARLPGGEQRFALGEGHYRLGSSPESDLCLRQATVSRRHAEIRISGVKATIRDLGSSNGTTVNGARLTEWTRIAPGDSLRVGQVELAIEELSDDDLTAAIAGEPRAATLEAPAPATLATGVVGDFCINHLRSLLASMSNGQNPTRFAGQLARALQISGGGAVDIEREGGVVASAGDGDKEPSLELRRGPWRLALSGYRPEQRPAIEELAALALDLLSIAGRRNSGPAETIQGGPGNPDRSPQPPDPPTNHKGLQQIYSQAASVARGHISVLIEGESGTGKELLANFIHRGSAERDKPLVVLNCASLARDLLEAELFGIEKGVATGVDARPGKFELADQGALFLDEIGDMAPETQAKILRVLQQQEVHRVGGHRAHPARVRVISATNRPIHELVSAGQFRRDLFHRIADWTVRLPTLRERSVDIPNLAAHFLREACRDAGKTFGGLSKGAVSALKGHAWPGNVRELEREMQRCALFLGDGEMLESSMLQTRILQSENERPDVGLQAIVTSSERNAILRALQATDGSVVDAAKMLRVGRSTLYRRMSKLGIDA